MIKKLQDIEKNNPRAPVYVESEYFQSDDYTHGIVHSVNTGVLPITGGDGFVKENKDGTQHEKFVVILSGQ